MSASKMTSFCKREDCPSSCELLEYQNGETRSPHRSDINRHLASCEFCSAEVEFYTHYPQEEGLPVTAAIPGPLFELAECLLKNRSNHKESLDTLWTRSDRATGTKKRELSN